MIKENIIIVNNNKEDGDGYYIANRFDLRTDYIADIQYIPLYDLDAFAGLIPVNIEEHQPEDVLVASGIPHCDGAIHVRGDSMSPVLENGDTVLFKTTLSRRGGLYFGEMYVISFVEDGDEHIVIKYLDEAKDPTSYTLRSENPQYAPRDIPRSSVRAIALVKASIRLYTN